MSTLVDRAYGHVPAQRSARFTALVVVPNPFAREALARSLRTAGARDILEAASGAEARVRARSGVSRELALVAGSLPDTAGATLVADLRAAGWLHAVLLSPTDDPYAVRAALAAGARGYLVVAPEQPGTQAAVPLPASASRYSPRGLVSALSAREIEVLGLVSHGKSNKEVGDALGLSALTVKSHLARISRKLGTGDRAEMVVIALRAGVIE